MPLKVTKNEIREQAYALGAEFVGFAPSSSWEEFGEVQEEFRPHKIWPPAKTVIVLGVPLHLPIGDEFSAVLQQPQLQVTSDLLDEAAYRLAVFLNRKGYPSVNIPRDSCGADLSDQKTIPVFSHTWAGYYAGIQQGNRSNNQPARQYSPAWNLVSILTALVLPGDGSVPRRAV